jgi:uncharacterized protein (DUF2249 family)
MATDTSSDYETVVDARAVEGEPFGDIVAALESLDADERLLLINSFEPVPLYDVLDERGFAHDTAQVDDEEWHVEIERA